MALARMIAFCLDWLVLAVWGGTVFGLAMLGFSGNPPRFESPWHGQVVSALVMTLPFILYFAFLESSSAQATLGKRALRMQVVHHSGERISFLASFLRNVLKFVPWEFGHMVAHHAGFAVDVFPMWLWVPVALAMGGCLWWLAALFMTHEMNFQ